MPISNRLAVLDDVHVDDVSGLSHLASLTELGIFGRSEVADISALAKLQNLYLLSLSHSQVSDIEPLRRLTKLERLYLADTPVADIGPLENLKRLRNLDLSNTQVEDVRPLAGLENLRRIELCGAPVSQEQFAELKAALPHCRIFWP